MTMTDVLFLHGGPTMDCSYLKPWFEPLRPDYRLVFWDQKSQTLGGLYDEFQSQMKTLTRPVIVAHSWGAFLLLSALQKGVIDTKDIGAVIFIAPMLLTDERSKRGMEIVKARFSVQDAKEYDAIVNDWKPDSAVKFMKLITPYYHFDRQFDVGGNMMFDKEVSSKMNAEISGYDYRACVELLPQDTLIIYGQHDYIWPEDEYHGQAQCHIIPDAGHYVFAEKQQETLKIIRNFLEDHHGE